ncbi:MAG: caspase family protein [Pseudomonadota bacterium]
MREADRRIALVIGNNTYRHVPPLEKAANDARAVGEALKKVGYKTTVLLEANQRRMNSAINRFVEDLDNGGMGVLFFAGHGVQINNQNFLLPVDFEQPSSEADVADQAVSLQAVQDKLAQARTRFTLLVVDACRDNPLPRKTGRSFGLTRGLAQASSAEGQIVVFSAGANQQALDKLGQDDRHPNGVFTREFLPWIERPGVSIRDAILEVRSAVRQRARSVNHDQFPAVYDQAEGEFYFSPSAKPRLLSPSQAELLFWQSVQGSESSEDFAEYLHLYPEGLFAGLAKRKQAALAAAERPVVAETAPASAPIVPTPAQAKPVAPHAQATPASPLPAPVQAPAPISIPIPAPAVLSVAAPSVQSTPPSPSPVNASRAWDYEVIEQYGRNVVGRYRVEVGPDSQGQTTERIRINNGARTLTRTLKDEGGLDMQVFRLPNDTNYWITDFSPYLANRPLPATDHIWPVTLPMGDMGPCSGKAQVRGQESVKVPAGTFQATRIRLECRFQKVPQRSTDSTLFLDAWYVPELGRVARIDKRVPPTANDDLGEERESYQLKRVEGR